jgi:hypothetical protein
MHDFYHYLLDIPDRDECDKRGDLFGFVFGKLGEVEICVRIGHVTTTGEVMRKLIKFAEFPLSKSGKVAVAELAWILVVFSEVLEHV